MGAEYTATIESLKPKTECGVFGVYLHPSLANNHIVEFALEHSIDNQHRGEESSGFDVSDGCTIWPPVKKMGLIRELYVQYLEEVQGNGGRFGHIVNVHNRYSTTGSSNIENAGPFALNTDLGRFAVSHNGNITNAAEIKAQLLSKGFEFSSTTDSEVITALIADTPGNTWQEKISNALPQLKGAFCLVISTRDKLFCARDRIGFHPLFLGEFGVGDKRCYAVSSETPALTKLGSHMIRKVEPGELIEINFNSNEERVELNSSSFAEPDEHLCGLEVAYLMRPDGYWEGVQLNTIRRHHGKLLAQYYPAPDDIDLITYIPESSKSIAEGYAEELSAAQNRHIPLETSLLKGRYGTLKNGSHRGFISPDLDIRNKVARTNYHAYDVVIGKKILALDDSIIGAVTTKGVTEKYKKQVGLYRDAGAKEVHLRIGLPEVIDGCSFGVDIDSSRYLIAKAHNKALEKMRQEIGADSLAFLTVQLYRHGVNAALGKQQGLCMGCTTGVYPEAVPQINKQIFEESS